MKEKALSDDDILKHLKQENYVQIVPICQNCMLEVIKMVSDNLEDADFSVHKMEKSPFYCLTIIGYPEE